MVTLHNGNVDHTAGQREQIASPAIALPDFGGDPYNIFMEASRHQELPTLDLVFFDWSVSYYPWTNPNTGGTQWSPQGSDTPIYAGGPFCERTRFFANDTTNAPDGVGFLGIGFASGQELIPSTAESVQVFLTVISTSGSDSGNFSPIWDNIRVGVSNAASVIHVPSPTHPTIQAGIDSAAVGDTVLVRRGIYTGPGNRDLNFNGKDIVLLSEEGSGTAIVDCEGVTRAMTFENGETAAARVEGMSFVNGFATTSGGAIRITDGSPAFADCSFDDCTVDSTIAIRGGRRLR